MPRLPHNGLLLGLLHGGLLFGLTACSDGDNPSVSEAPHPSSTKERQSDRETYVIQLPGGLEAEVLVEGTGRVVRANDWITVHYRGSVLAASVLAKQQAAEKLAAENEASIGDAPKADTAEGDTAEGDTAEAETPEGDTAKEDTSEAETPEGEAGDAKADDAPAAADGEAVAVSAPAEESAAAELPAEDYVFGNTFKSGVPLRLSLERGQAIEGWRKGLTGLRVGSRVILRVPSELAYGEKGLASTRIPANADLEYEIEILDAVARADRR